MAATLKMVAEAANVSIRTAGRALSGSGPVKSEVAKRVLAAARELHYVPNAAARLALYQSCQQFDIAHTVIYAAAYRSVPGTHGTEHRKPAGRIFRSAGFG